VHVRTSKLLCDVKRALQSNTRYAHGILSALSDACSADDFLQASIKVEPILAEAAAVAAAAADAEAHKAALVGAPLRGPTRVLLPGANQCLAEGSVELVLSRCHSPASPGDGVCAAPFRRRWRRRPSFRGRRR
jgi:hypothetical protein